VWLNNCVGRQNILAFYMLLVSAAAMMLTQIAVGAYDIYVFTTPAFVARLASFYPSASPLGIFVVLLAVWLITLAVMGLVVQLLSFHSLLVLRDLTTYDFIVQRGQERQGLEVVPGHGSSLAVYCYGYRKASPMTPRDHAAAAALYQPAAAQEQQQQQQQQQPSSSDPYHLDATEVGLELRSAAAGGDSPPPPPPPPAPAQQPPQLALAPQAGGGAGGAPQPSPTSPRKQGDPYADLI
jgi:hypothetical protein